MQGARRIITGVTGSPGSVRALRYAAELAGLYRAPLVPVLAWTPPGGELADRRYPSGYLRRVWRRAAAQQLADAVQLAFGGAGPEVPIQPVVLRGDPGRVLVAAVQAGDVLVVGAGRRGRLRLARGKVARFCQAHASCPVIAVPPAELAGAASGIRGWALRHRGLTPRAAGVPAAGRR